MAKKAKRKSAKGKNKGSKFEREICKLFSLWWTDRERDDVFWRTSNSGGRATFRAKKGRGTFGQYGDIQATDAIGQPLINVCNIEIKRGYSDQTMFNLLDRLPHHVESGFEKFVLQAEADREKADTFTWLLIVKRDGKNTIVFLPRKLWRALSSEEGVYLGDCKMLVKSRTRFTDGKARTLYGMTLNDFFDYVRPIDFQRIDAVWRDAQEAGDPTYQ